MDDAALVRRGQAGADLPRHLERALHREPADAAQQRAELLAVDVLHREEGVAVDLVDVVDAADVRMRHLPRHPHFAVQLHQPRGIVVDFRGQELERDRLRQLEIVGAIHLAHAAAAETPDDAVAAAEQGAGRKPPVVDGVRRREPAARRGPGFQRRAAGAAAIGLQARRAIVGGRRQPGEIVVCGHGDRRILPLPAASPERPERA